MQEVRLHGKHCSYNAFAFPLSVEVRWGGRAKQEPEPRAKQEARAESEAGGQSREQRMEQSGPKCWCNMRARSCRGLTQHANRP